MQPKKNFRKNGKESTGGCFPAAAPHNLPPSPPSGSRPVTNGTNSPILSAQGVFLLQATTASGTATRKIISKFSPFNFQFSIFTLHRCVVLYPVDFQQCVSLIFPFLKRKKSGKRSNNERINDDPSTTDYSCQTLVILVVKKGKK